MIREKHGGMNNENENEQEPWNDAAKHLDDYHMIVASR